MTKKNENNKEILDISIFGHNFDPSLPNKDDVNLLFEDSCKMEKALDKFNSFSDRVEVPVKTEEAAWGRIVGEDSSTFEKYSIQAVVDEPQVVESKKESKVTLEEELSTRSSDGGNGRGRPK